MTFPKFRVCLVCEFAKGDVNTPATIAGLYGAAPYAAVPMERNAQLTFMLLTEPQLKEHGKFTMALEVTDPNGKAIFQGGPTESVLPEAPDENGVLHFIFSILNVAIEIEGIYKLKVFIDNKLHYENTFRTKAPAKSK